ncbi:Ribophorin I [Nadsonia fulvescens var. elongata DSM 6958]|uniref:Dolichyl-diphosphooligosaccharide--protein glycosyltransferase subunit 1 n=1 Tax=Nadsonia fulvescens var. elongata DSM 6958 TaxID=857566 RepID=A0A1E3PL93_9ASCO|nr:Ribophorin I [Nadsonia fulvescens var. elongata DSM 6958]
MKWSLSFISLCGSAISCAFASDLVLPNFKNIEFSRRIDLSRANVHLSDSITIQNIAKVPQSEYFYALDATEVDNVALFFASHKKSQSRLEIRDVGVDFETDTSYYSIKLPYELQPQDTIEIQILKGIVNCLKPLPEFVDQNEKQFLLYTGSKIPLSAYPIGETSTKLAVLGSTVDELDPEEGFEPNVSDNNLLFGPYKDIHPLSSKTMLLRYDSPIPLVKVDKLEREAWISHWSNQIAFEERYWLSNLGAKIKDGFSRLKFMKSARFNVNSQNFKDYNINFSSVRELTVPLQAGSENAYYTDLVGNVSTSRFRVDEKGSLLQLKPRYPIFGGWNYNFTIGWEYDLKKSLKKDGERYLVKIPFIEGPVDVSYNEIDLTVILPEGATAVKVEPSIVPKDTAEFTTYSFFDSIGRPSVKLSYDTIMDHYRREVIIISYELTTRALYQKPVAISAVFGAFFVTIYLLSQINLNISSTKKNKL